MEGAGRGRVLLLSLRLAVGLNLQGGVSHMVMLAPEWNPSTDVQALGRLARPGQLKETFHYRLGVAGFLALVDFLGQFLVQGFGIAAGPVQVINQGAVAGLQHHRLVAGAVDTAGGDQEEQPQQ